MFSLHFDWIFIRYRSLGDVVLASASVIYGIKEGLIEGNILFLSQKKLLPLLRILFKENGLCEDNGLHCGNFEDFKSDTLKASNVFDFQNNLRTKKLFKGKVRKVPRFERFKQVLKGFNKDCLELDPLLHFIKQFSNTKNEEIKYPDRYSGEKSGPILWIQASAWSTKLLDKSWLLSSEYKNHRKVKVLLGLNQKFNFDIPKNIEIVKPDLKWPELIGVIKSCSFFISGDTGFYHICELLGIPGLLVLGPTGPETGTYSHHCQTSIVQSQLFCSPCSFYGKEGCYHTNKAPYPCMTKEKKRFEILFQEFLAKY